MLHCPKCGVELLTTDRHGVEIDYCPQCRGMWLDRRELDKIVERATESARGQYKELTIWPEPSSQPGLLAVDDV
jgi:uncharacterized protein